MMNANAKLWEIAKLVVGLAPIVPSSSTPRRVSLKNYEKATVTILTRNEAAGATGSAITLHQSSAVDGTGEKAIAFSEAMRNIDAAAGDALASFAVTSNTFTTDNTASKQTMYVVEISPAMLDVEGGFDVIRAGTANATNTTVAVMYTLWPAKYAKDTPPSAIID